MESSASEPISGRALSDWTRLMVEGDDAAWHWFHSRYYVALLRYAAQRSGDTSAATEIVQQAYLRIARHAKPFSTERDFSNWLFCVVRCATMDHVRHHKRRSLLAEKYAHWRAAQVESDHDLQHSNHQTAELTHEALSKLSARDAALLRRKYCEGIPTAELALEFGATSKTIEHRLARLRGLLKQIILEIQ